MSENKKEEGLIEKATKLVHATVDNALTKAKNGLRDKEVERVSLDFDPFYTGTEGGAYNRKPTRVSYKTLDLMAKRDSIIASIITTRINQVASFSEKQKTKYDIGYVIEPAEESVEITDKEKAEIEALSRFIENCGEDEDLRPPEDKMKMDEFLRRCVRDRLVFDQVAIEKVRSLDGKLSYFVPVDGSTIRHATKKEESKVDQTQTLRSYDPKRKDLDKNDAEVKDLEYVYVQVVEETIQRAFTREDLMFKMANITNDIKSKGYSISELETLLGMITSHLNAESYNKRFFTQGHVQRGILHFKANISQRKLNMFKKAWYAQTSGVANSWRTPIIAGMDEVKWIDLGQTHKDIEFHLWMEYCIKIMCAIFLMDPSEINFDISQGRSEGNPMFTSKNEHKLKQSKDRGLRPLLRFFEDIYNDILKEISDGKYVFKFCGLEADDQDTDNKRYETETGVYKTINEVRKECGLESIDLTFEVGDKKINPYDIPLNSQAVQLIQFLAGQESQEQQAPMGPDGAPTQSDDDSALDLGSSINDNQDTPDVMDNAQQGNTQNNEPESNEMLDYNSEEDFGKSKKIKIEYFQVNN